MHFTKEQYEEERKNFRWDIPENFSIVKLVESHATQNPDKPCVVWESERGEKRTLTWSELSELSARFSGLLAGLGVGKGNPVMHLLPRLPETFVAQIGPFEVEDALVSHPAVAEAAVVGSPDPERGEIVKAFVILSPGFEPSEELVRKLQEHVKRVTAPYKYPRKIEFAEELPKTASGKIKRAELRRRERRKEMA